MIRIGTDRRLLAIIPTIFVVLISLECFLSHDGLLLFFKRLGSTLSLSTSKCPSGTFRTGKMVGCQPFLGCPEINQDLVVTDHLLGEGAQKVVKKGVWQDHEVAVSFLKHQSYLSDFLHGLTMLQLYAEEPGHRENRVVQLIGWCLDSLQVIVTEMYPLGAASGVHNVLRGNFPGQDSVLVRFRMCINFVQILNMLHTHLTGPRVLCDANYPEKALSQFLLTDNLSLVLNDMDALPLVDKESGQLIKCGHRELQGDFVAPEQRWHLDEDYDDSKMTHYDEKVDIWKIPDICNFLINDVQGASRVQLHLFEIHLKCKQTEPSKRPCAKDVLTFYEKIYEKIK